MTAAIATASTHRDEAVASLAEQLELPPGAILVTDAGEIFRLDECRELQPVLPGGYPRPGAAHATAVGGNGPSTTVLGRAASGRSAA